MPELETLQIDEKWAVQYDPKNNDQPVYITRHGEHPVPFAHDNFTTALFYALLEAKDKLGALPS